MIMLMNERAIMLANPTRYTNPWKDNQQQDFTQAISYFKDGD